MVLAHSGWHPLLARRVLLGDLPFWVGSGLPAAEEVVSQVAAIDSRLHVINVGGKRSVSECQSAAAGRLRAESRFTANYCHSLAKSDRQ